MIKIKKKLAIVVFGMFLAIGTVFPTNAQGVQIQDDSDYLTAAEELTLTEIVEEAEETTAWDMIVLMIDDAQGMATREYGEEFIANHKEMEDTVAFIIDLDNREVALVTMGEVPYYLTDARIEDTIDSGYDNVVDGSYADAFSNMIEKAVDFYHAGADGNSIYNEDTGEITKYEEPNRITILELLIILAVTIAAGGGFAAFIIGKYRIKWGGYKYSYQQNGKIQLTNSRDVFVDQFVTRRRIQKNDNNNESGGSASVHSGAGGNDFGGGSKGF